MKLLIAVTAFALLFVGGCAAFKDENTQLRLVTQYSVLKTIENSSSITAAGVLATVERARAVVADDGPVTVGLLSVQVRALISWEQLDAADRMLLDAVLIEAEAELERRIGSGVLQAEDKVAVLTLLDWIATAARMA